MKNCHTLQPFASGRIDAKLAAMLEMNRRSCMAAFVAATVTGCAWHSTAAQTQTGIVRVVFATGAGAISLDLFADRAPITTANFLKYIDLHLFDAATIYRALRTPGAPQTGLIQGGARFDSRREIKPIAHESTILTGLAHKDGVISLARRELGSARSDFFICVGDASYLDADPKAPGDNQGFAAFGRVVEGMDVVRKILSQPTSATAPIPEMAGQMLDPPVPILTARRAAPNL